MDELIELHGGPENGRVYKGMPRFPHYAIPIPGVTLTKAIYRETPLVSPSGARIYEFERIVDG